MLLSIAVAILIVVAMLGVGAKTTVIGAWYQTLKKSRLTPPNWVFAPAWTFILACAGASGVIASVADMTHTRFASVFALYGLNIIAHMAWSPLFFHCKRPDYALLTIVWLWLTLAGLLALLAPVSTSACLLLVPYIVWVSFALYLNVQIVRLNAPIAGQA